MNYLSVCSGIEAATVAWHPLGWKPVAFSEIEKFPSQVLAHHYPDVPNVGDMTKFKEWNLESAIDVFVGGTPCQSFSVAGLRKGLDDPRGNLMLTYLAIADKYRPKWLVWENVPGVLSSNAGKDFGTFLGGLGELGYGFAYRVLDAQYFGVAQRRRRVFVVGYLGDWQRAAQVLFESESVCRDIAPSRKKKQETAGSTGDGIARCITAGEMKRQDWETCNFIAQTIPFRDPCPTLTARMQGSSGWAPANEDAHLVGSLCARTCQSVSVQDAMQNHLQPMAYVTHSLRGEGFDASEDGTGRGTPLVPVPISFGAQMSVPQVDFDLNQTLQAKNPMAVAASMQVRRLTPVECERLQRFPDGYTAIPWKKKTANECPDGPRYKALGNSMAVPVMRWIGERIQSVDVDKSSHL
jgi:DNA (cytosine-5)-methyltransferase 1